MTEMKVLHENILGDKIGFVKYIGHLGSDKLIVEAARQSTQKGFLGWNDGKDFNSIRRCSCDPPMLPKHLGLVSDNRECHCEASKPGDEKLLEYLMANNHTTPFEMSNLIVQVKAPIMVFREWHRHRTFSYNEMSARYIQMPNEHYIPIPRLQDKKNKQSSFGSLDEDSFGYNCERQQNEIYNQYEAWLEKGIAKEVARINTPVSRYSIMYTSANLHNWFHFLKLRMAPNAQWEIRQYANAVSEIIKFLWPRSYALFEEYRLNAVSFSASEMKEIREILKDGNYIISNKTYTKIYGAK